jgi:hypothetical protein
MALPLAASISREKVSETVPDAEAQGPAEEIESSTASCRVELSGNFDQPSVTRCYGSTMTARRM